MKIDGDAALMLAFRAGDRAAFETLFRRYTPPLVNFLARMVRDRARAEELAQEVFLRIHNAAGRYEARARFSTWMFGIARNLALNDLDRAYRRYERPVSEPHELDSKDPAPDAVERLNGQRLGETLGLALDRLPERQRAALLLRSEQDLDYREIAEVLETSVSSVKSLLHRAREALLAELKEVAE